MLKACTHAGSGKTLAYLLPLVQCMREEEQSASNSLTLRNSPRVVVLAPTAELCMQVDCPSIVAAVHVYREAGFSVNGSRYHVRHENWQAGMQAYTCTDCTDRHSCTESCADLCRSEQRIAAGLRMHAQLDWTAPTCM